MSKNRQTRSMVASELITRQEEDSRTIEGYFAVFDSLTKLYPGVYEKIDRHAFDNTLEGDIRALINHDGTLVLGRTKAKTLELSVDEKGLYGKITINPKDGDAVNLYERVKRGDVSQCSFGFGVVEESYEVRGNGDVEYTLEDVILYEVSVCTFPAYKQTGVVARSEQAEEIRREKLKDWKESMKERLERGSHA